MDWELVLKVAVALPIAHLANVFCIWLIHYLLHQKILSIPFYRIHLLAHHRVDSISKYRLDRLTLYEHLVWATLTLTFFLGYYLFLPYWMAATFIIEAIFTLVIVYLIHDEYEKPRSPLERFTWFKRGQAHHRVHHKFNPKRQPEQMFSQSVNYAFGGILTGFLLDQLFGTYQSIDKHS